MFLAQRQASTLEGTYHVVVRLLLGLLLLLLSRGSLSGTTGSGTTSSSGGSGTTRGDGSELGRTLSDDLRKKSAFISTLDNRLRRLV